MSNMRGETHSLHCDCVNPAEIPDMRNVSREEFEALAKQTAEIHSFIQMLGSALNNPMVRAMIPANLRGNIGG